MLSFDRFLCKYQSTVLIQWMESFMEMIRFKVKKVMESWYLWVNYVKTIVKIEREIQQPWAIVSRDNAIPQWICYKNWTVSFSQFSYWNWQHSGTKKKKKHLPSRDIESSEVWESLTPTAITILHVYKAESATVHWVWHWNSPSKSYGGVVAEFGDC